MYIQTAQGVRFTVTVSLSRHHVKRFLNELSTLVHGDGADAAPLTEKYPLLEAITLAPYTQQSVIDRSSQVEKEEEEMAEDDDEDDEEDAEDGDDDAEEDTDDDD